MGWMILNVRAEFIFLRKSAAGRYSLLLCFIAIDLLVVTILIRKFSSC
jgi:hypothetical protein